MVPVTDSVEAGCRPGSHYLWWHRYFYLLYSSDISISLTYISGNVRNDIISTLRYSIEAGVAIIGPFIIQRSPDLIEIDTKNETDISYLFDQAFMRSKLAHACPELRFFDSREDFEKTSTALTMVIQATPRDLPQDEGPVTSISPALDAQPAPAGSNLRVIFPAPFAYLPICIDGAPFADSIGGFIPFRQDAQRLAAAVLCTLAWRDSPHLNSSSPASAPPAFFGAHLRTAVDATAAGFPGYDMQAPRYFEIAKAHNLTSVFLASGDSQTTKQFIAEGLLEDPPLYVVTKHDLLDPADLKLLDGMSWDQQALVDYLVLVASSYFAGVSASSFSANVMVKRRVSSVSGSCGKGFEGTATDATYRDELSELVGEPKSSIFISNLYP